MLPPINLKRKSKSAREGWNWVLCSRNEMRNTNCSQFWRVPCSSFHFPYHTTFTGRSLNFDGPPAYASNLHSSIILNLGNTFEYYKNSCLPFGPTSSFRWITWKFSPFIAISEFNSCLKWIRNHLMDKKICAADEPSHKKKLINFLRIRQ